ncbi:hypothetical protein COTS27_00166 [Spirochaetota bacterium]|nr:hypothetical protein COTS27_00166 [Spirochaetota bacterium]
MTLNLNNLTQAKLYVMMFIMITSSLFLSNCGTLAPLRERDLAAANLALATEMEASQYAEAEVTSAETYFSSGEDLIVREKKSPDNSKAKANYIDSKEVSDTALLTALTALVAETDTIIETKRPIAVKVNLEDILQEAEAAQETAKTTLAEVLFPDSYAATKKARELLDQILEDDQYYIVILNEERRDCLWRIAEKFLADPKLWEKIYAVNKELIANPDLIYPGQRILIPKE